MLNRLAPLNANNLDRLPFYRVSLIRRAKAPANASNSARVIGDHVLDEKLRSATPIGSMNDLHKPGWTVKGRAATALVV